MGGNDLRQLLELQKALICKDQQRLESRIEKQVENIVQEQNEICDKSEHENNNEEQSSDIQENKENTQSLNTPTSSYSEGIKQQPPLIEPLNLSELNSHEDSVEEKKQAFINRISNLDNPLTSRSNDRNEHKMLRYGEYSPNNPQLRVSSQPYLGIGEYELSRNYLTQQRRSDYLDNLSESKSKVQYDQRKRDAEIELSPLRNYNSSRQSGRSSTPYAVDQKLTTQQNANAVDQRLTDLHDAYDVDRRLTSQHQNVPLIAEMDKPKSILSNRRTGSPRDRLMSQMQHSYTPSSFMDGFSYQDKTEEMERERKKREAYQHDLRTQIEENRRLQLVKDEQDRREQELENRRLEQQLLRMQEEALTDEQRSNQREEQIRRHSEDLLRRKHDLQSRQNYRKHTDSESSAVVRNTTNVASSHYSPPVSRRNPYSSASSYNVVPSSSVFAASGPVVSPTTVNRYPTNPNQHYAAHYNRRDALNRMDSLTYADAYEPVTYAAARSSNSNNATTRPSFGRFDSLSRLDSLNHRQQQQRYHDDVASLNRIESLTLRDGNLSTVQRRHSATQQDLSMLLRKSPKLQRRNTGSSGLNKFDDMLPVPVLKAHSPVAKELKNSVPFNSGRHGSEACRKLEDKWQIPAVQKTIINHSDSLRDGQSRSILTQLGAIRMQLQQEQLRMDESLRKRGITQSKAVDFH